MILLIGATGFTGQLVAAELLRLKCPVRLTARNSDRLLALRQGLEVLYHQLDHKTEYVVVDVTDPASIERALDGCGVVINCAGPFLELGEPVLAAAVRAGAHYLDTTGEQQFIKLAFEKYGAAAHQAGCGLIPSCAFEYALGDAAAAMLDGSGNTEWTEIRVVYSIQGMHTSRGTKKSVLKVLGQPPFGYEDGRVVEINPVRVFRNLELSGEGNVNAFTFPAGEIFLLPLHLKVKAITTLMVSTLPPVGISALSRVGKFVANSPVSKFLVRRIDAQSIGPPEAQRSSSTFTIWCEGTAPGKTKSIVMRGSDPYLLTSMIAGGVAKKLHFGPLRPSGPTSPSMVAGPEFIQQLTGQYVEWTEISP